MQNCSSCSPTFIVKSTSPPSHPVFGASSAGSGRLWTDGELVSGDVAPKCQGSDAGAPIKDVQNLLLKVGQYQGCVEVRGAGRLLVV